MCHALCLCLHLLHPLLSPLSHTTGPFHPFFFFFWDKILLPSPGWPGTRRAPAQHPESWVLVQCYHPRLSAFPFFLCFFSPHNLSDTIYIGLPHSRNFPRLVRAQCPTSPCQTLAPRLGQLPPVTQTASLTIYDTRSVANKKFYQNFVHFIQYRWIIFRTPPHLHLL